MASFSWIFKIVAPAVLVFGMGCQHAENAGETKGTNNSLFFFDCSAQIRSAIGSHAIPMYGTLSISSSLAQIYTWVDTVGPGQPTTPSQKVLQEGRTNTSLNRSEKFHVYSSTSDEGVEFYAEKSLLDGKNGQFVIVNPSSDDNREIKMACAAKRK